MIRTIDIVKSEIQFKHAEIESLRHELAELIRAKFSRFLMSQLEDITKIHSEQYGEDGLKLVAISNSRYNNDAILSCEYYDQVKFDKDKNAVTIGGYVDNDNYRGQQMIYITEGYPL